MDISDELYGEYEIEEVLTALIYSKEVQRLKDIHMIGPSYLLNPVWNETRYEHSVGVMLLVRKLGGSVEEQIAGLLHDISHTIFSHVIDLVMDKQQEDYHEEIKQTYLSESSIPDILSSYGYNYEKILLDDCQWTRLEQAAPLLCADRIDYTLREVYRYFKTDLNEIHDFLSEIVFLEGKIVLKSVSAGEWFVKQYYKIVLDLFYDPLNMYGYEIMGRLLSYALEQGCLSTEDLMKTETEVLNKLKALGDPKLDELFCLFYTRVAFKLVDENEPFDIFQKKKLRLIDPLVAVEGDIVYTSACSIDAKRRTAEAKKKSDKGVYLLVTKPS
ncbi:HD domain-containing protein [Enterococcus sp. LJL51]|uniref:HD domain-containing protein n=1 Tax=Enterococcus sp. LJL51 TaxID=3416656 RepID=UPI003CF13BB4